jgi:hypothetical protein
MKPDHDLVRCSLCTTEFYIDEDLIMRMKRHEQFHREYRIRNLNHGLVQWNIVRSRKVFYGGRE